MRDLIFWIYTSSKNNGFSCCPFLQAGGALFDFPLPLLQVWWFTSGQTAALKNGKPGKALWDYFTHSAIAEQGLFC